MAFAERAELVARLSLKDDFSGKVKGISSSLSGLEGRFGKLGSIAQKGISNAANNLKKLGVVATGALAFNVHRGIESLATLEDAVVSVDEAIKQMGFTGQITGKQVAQWGNEIEDSVERAFDDKAITQAATTLLRFGKLTPQNLRPALVVMTDLAAKTGDVESAASLLARALADPTKAMGMLRRAGVVLTQEQQDQVTAMVKAGNAAGAQAFLLQQLEKSTKGAAAAMHGPYRDALNILADVTEDAQRALGEAFLPVLSKVANKLSHFLEDPRNVEQIRQFGRGLADSFDKLLGVAGRIPWDAIGNSLKIAGAGAKAVFDAFVGLPPWVQTAVLTGWGLNKLSGGALGTVITEGVKIGMRGLAGRLAGLLEDLSLGRGLKGSLFGGGGFFSRGASPAAPLFTKEVGLGGGAGVPAPVAAGGLGVLAAGAALVTIAAVEVAAADQLGQALRKAVTGSTAPLAKDYTVAQLGPLQVGLFRSQAQIYREGVTKTQVAVEKLRETEQAGHSEAVREMGTEARRTQAAIDKARDATESSRIALASQLGQTRGAFQSGTDRIVGAIQKIPRPVTNIRIGVRTTTVVKVGGTLHAVTSGIEFTGIPH